MTAILGLSSGYHDAAAAVVSDHGDILFAGHAERYSRVKNDPNLNDELLQAAWLSAPNGITDIAWYESPFLKHTRQVYSGEKSLFSLPDNPKHNIKQYLNGFFKSVPVTTHYHHKSHAAAGFQTSPYDRAIVLVVDAIGEWDCWSIWKAYHDKDGYAKYQKLWSRKYPHSLGLLYSAFTQKVGLKPNEDEYITMGMAAHGNDLFHLDVWDEFIEQNEFQMELSKFNFTLNHNVHAGLLDEHTDAEYNTAACIQKITEKVLHSAFLQVRRYCTQYRIDNIVYSGGVAMNCVANSYVLKNSGKSMWIAPNPTDSGSALGAAALQYGKKLNYTDMYLGSNILGEYPVKELLGSLKTDKITAVASGRAEFGARALGNRSILADPRDPNIKDKVNEIKKRQKFRPFAPVVLQEYADEHFELKSNLNYDTMQYAVKIKPESIDLFPGIEHIDHTARIQTVPKDCKSGIRQLLEQWYFWSGGCPMLLNTSLNIKGEPIVNTRADADRFEKKYKLKVHS